MLNKQQRNFRKTMKEIEQQNSEKSNIYSYREQRFSREKPKRQLKRPFLQIGGLFGLVILIWNIYAFSTYFSPEDGNIALVSTQNLAVHNYLQTSGETEVEIQLIVNSLIEQYNSNSLTSFHIEEAQQNLFELQKGMPLNNNRFALMNHYFSEQFGLAFQLTNILEQRNAPTVNQELTYLIEKQTELVAGRDNILIQLLKEEKMSYKILSDGSITYEY